MILITKQAELKANQPRSHIEQTSRANDPINLLLNRLTIHWRFGTAFPSKQLFFFFLGINCSEFLFRSLNSRSNRSEESLRFEVVRH